MATRINNEWEEVVDITYRVVEEQLGRGKPMDTALARTLHVAGLYEDWLRSGNQHQELYTKVDEILETWKNTKNDGLGSRINLIEHLRNHQQANSCQPLIFALANSQAKAIPEKHTPSTDKLFAELKKYELEDLYDIFSSNGINASMVWRVTEEETKTDIRMNIGQGKRYWEARKKMELEKCLGSGRYAQRVLIKSEGAAMKFFGERLGMYELDKSFISNGKPTYKHHSKNIYLHWNHASHWTLSPKEDIVKHWGFIYNSKSEDGLSPQDSPQDGWLVYLQHLSKEIQHKYQAEENGWAQDSTFVLRVVE